MAVEKYEPGIGVAAGLLMLKWDLLDRELGNQLQSGQDVYLFINFETILENLTNRMGLTSSIVYYKQDVVLELEAAVLNMIGHYRSYFRKLRCNPKILLYYTDLTNKEPQQMSSFNKYYRNFYKNLFLQNPQFRALGEVLTDTIIPELRLILSYIQGCYFLSSSTFDSSIIPMIISNIEGGVNNVIITGDLFDTLYLFNNYKVFYVRRRFKYSNIASDMDAILQAVVKSEDIFDIGLFHQQMYYRLLLAVIGSKMRNITGGYGFGVGKLLSLLKAGVDTGNVLKDYTSIESIINLFPLKQQEGIKGAFQCMNLDTHYSLLGDADIGSIKDQLVDRFDPSITTLNDARFRDYPINIQSLLY